MKYFKDNAGTVLAYEQSDIETVVGIAELEEALSSAQLKLSSLEEPVAPDGEEDDEEYENALAEYQEAQESVRKAQADLNSVNPVFFSIRENLSELTMMTDEEVRAHLSSAAVPLMHEQVEAQRLKAYADPLTGSDRYFAEALRLQAIGAPQEEIDAANASGAQRYAEIQAEYPWP